MAQIVASLTLPPDPGNRFLMVTYHAVFSLNATGQTFDVQLLQNGTSIRIQRWNTPSDPLQMYVDWAQPVFLGPQNGNMVYEVAIVWGGGAGGQVTTYADPNFNYFAVSAFGAGGA